MRLFEELKRRNVFRVGVVIDLLLFFSEAVLAEIGLRHVNDFITKNGIQHYQLGQGMGQCQSIDLNPDFCNAHSVD